MGIRYDLTALELLNRLGWAEPVGETALAQMEDQLGCKIPAVLRAFLSTAANCPLLRTADLWTQKLGEAYTFYDQIQEMVDAEKEYWEDSPEDCEANEYVPFWKLPRERWGELSGDYLLIGSDSGAGVVQFGVRVQDLGEADPPVYWNHECDPITDWNAWDQSVSDFLMRTLCDVLCCGEYGSAERVMKKAGWTVNSLERKDLARLDCDEASLLRWASTYGADAVCGCCYDEEAGQLLAVRMDRADPKYFQGREYLRP